MARFALYESGFCWIAEIPRASDSASQSTNDNNQTKCLYSVLDRELRDSILPYIASLNYWAAKPSFAFDESSRIYFINSPDGPQIVFVELAQEVQMNNLEADVAIEPAIYDTVAIVSCLSHIVASSATTCCDDRCGDTSKLIAADLTVLLESRFRKK